MIQFYYRLLMWSLRLVAGHNETETWTFHKGCLRILGNDWKSKRPKMSLVRILWTILYPLSYIMLLAVSVVLTVKYAITILKLQGKSDILQFIRAMNGFIVSIAYVYAAAKAILFKVQGSTLLRLMDSLEDLGPLDDHGKPHRDQTLLNCTLYMGLLFITPGAWTIYFVFFHQAIPYPTEFPWSEDTHLGYVASFATDFVTAVYCAALHSVYDTLFPMTVGVISGHLASLRAKLAQLGTGKLSAKEETDIIRRCYKLHVNILKVMRQVNKSFRLLFLVQTTYTVLHACVIIYQVMQVSDIALAIMNTSPILSSAYFQLLMYCYYGQLLTNNFEKLKEGLYENSWYSCELRVKKALCLMTLAADRPVKLESFGITSAAHPTYLSNLIPIIFFMDGEANYRPPAGFHDMGRLMIHHELYHLSCERQGPLVTVYAVSLQDSISYYLILKTLTTQE